MRLVVQLTVCATIALTSTALGAEVIGLDPDSAEGWDSARDTERLAREFSLYEVRPMGAHVAWEFVLREGAFADLHTDAAIPRDFESIDVRIRNRGPRLDLAVKLADAGGAEWTAPSVRLAGDEEWRTVRFPREEWGVASWSSDADGALDFPTLRLAVIAFGVEPGPEYALDIASIQAVLPDRPVLQIAELAAPTAATAGQGVVIELEARMDGEPLSDEAQIVLADEAGHTVSLPLRVVEGEVAGGAAFRAVADGSIPTYAFGGAYAVQVRIGEARVATDTAQTEDELARVQISQREIEDTSARVASYRGTPTLHINDEPTAGMTYTAYGPSVEVFEDFAEEGVRLFSFSATPTEAGYGLSRTTWVAPGEYDYSQLDERALMVLQACPDAFIFPRIYLHAPPWWSEEHPDDLVIEELPDGTRQVFIHSGGKPAPSWASEAWRTDTIQAIERMVEHVEASPYADRVIGYHIASGTTEEWMMWGGNEGSWVDYSPVNQTKFRAWLRSKYETDVALQAAWADRNVTLETADIPSRAERERTSLGYLRDPAIEAAVIDFYLYNSWLVADTINTFAAATKEIAGRNKVVGVFYGYLLQLIGEHRMQNAGHLALDQVLTSPDVDFLTSPTSYMFRDPGVGTSHFMSLTGSVRHAGKLWLDENDIRTSLAPGEVGGWGKQPTIDGDILQQNRELGNVIASGVGQWWFDVGRNRYDDPRLMAHLGELRQAADRAMEYARAPADEVAFVVDGPSLAYAAVGAPITRWLLRQQIPQAYRIGAPIGWYTLDDVGSLPPKRMYVFLNAWAPTEDQRAAIDSLKSDGRVLVFVGPAGVYEGGSLSPPGMSELVGMDLGWDLDPALLRCEGDRLSFGTDQPFGPMAYPDDPAATVLARLPDGRPGLALLDAGDWTAVHSAAPALPARLLRDLAIRAGVHLYTQDAVVYASEGLLSVNVNEGGSRIIDLPERATVTDLVTGEVLAENATRFTLEIADRDTRILGLR
jgi:hypothetical protein